LKESDIENVFDGYRAVMLPGGLGNEAQAASEKKFLSTVYEVLDDRQQKRLHEIMFQRWMNRDDMAKGLNAFAPNEVEDLSSKVSQLQAKIEKRREDTILELPVEQREYEKPLADFLAWRWERQIEWLEKELGRDRTQELVGEPITLAYNFITAGDPASGGQNQFGEPSGGGRYFGDSGGGWGSSNGVEHTTVGPFNPATGKVDKPDLKKLAEARRNGRHLPKRPVDVPKDWTLDNAWENLRDVEKRSEELTEQYAEQLDPRRRLGGRGGFEQRRVLESQLRIDSGLLSMELEKAERIVEELGGDPQAEMKEIRAAQNLFSNRGFSCNQPPFVSHVRVSAEQQNALDKIADDFGSNFQEFSPEERLDYNNAVLEVMDQKQKRLLKQVLFRKYWFSEDCELAFALTKVKLTDEQKEKVSSLAKQLRETNEEVQLAFRNSMRSRFMGPGIPIRSNREKQYKPLIAVAKAFNDTLEEIVGAKNAAALIGKPMERDSEWKRPVLVPAGLSIEDAKKQHEELEAKAKISSDELGGLFPALLQRAAAGGPDNVKAVMQESHESHERLQRQTEIAKRVYEELQAAEGK